MKRRHSHKVSIRIHNIGTPLISRSTGLQIESLHVDSDRLYTIGRSIDNGSCDFVLDHGGISRNHCQVLFDSQSSKLYIFDGVFSQNFDEFRKRLISVDKVEKEGLRFRVSLNGVYVNRVRVREGRVQEVLVGDEVLFVCGKEGLCYKDGRVGFVVQEIGFEGRDTKVSSGHSRGTFSGGKRSKRVFAPMDNEVSSLVSGFCPPEAVGVVERLNSIVSYCRHVLNSDDPVSCLRLSDSGKERLSCCTMLRSKVGSEVKRDDKNHEMGHGMSGLKVGDEWSSPELRIGANLAVSKLVSQVESEGAACISVSDKTRTMLTFDEEKENTPGNSNINREKSCQSSLQSPGKNFYLNRLQYIEQNPTGSQRVVSLPELLYPLESISQIFIATFTSDILWFLTGCEIPSHLPVTVACHHAERCWSSSPDSRTTTPLPNYPNVAVVFPPFPEEIAFGKDRKNRGIACHHPKLFILQREDSIRVIITSANLVARQWDDVTNTVWWQDFPRRANPDFLSLFSHFKKETNRGLRSDFGAQLAGFAATLLADVPSQAHWILELTKYNFEHSAGHLVASVPGIHSYKPSHLTESVRSSTCFNEEFLGSVEASVVGLSYLFRSTSDSTGAQLKRLASYISRTRENSLGMLELVMRRNTNVPADLNAVSVFVPNPDDDSRDEFVQLGFLPRSIAKWVSPLWDIGFFKFVGYVYRDEVLAAASCRSNQKVQLMLHVLQGVSISDMSKLIQPHHVIALSSLMASLQRCTGIWRLQEVLGCYKWPESQESDFVYSASSVGGSVTAGFQADFASAAGKKVQHFDSQESDPEWGCWSAREEREAPSIKIIFPTIERVKNGQHGVLSSRRLLCFSEKTWQKLRYNNVLHDAVPNPQDRVGHPMHIKVARRRFTSTRGSRSSSFGWVYCGSHNFSGAAWGQTISRSSRNNQDQSHNAMRSASKLRVCNYELGIVFVFPPPNEETDSCDGSKIDDIVLPFVVPAPKYGWSDKPATGLAMREALAEFREGSRSVFGESEAEEEVEEKEEEEEEAEAEGREEFVAEEEKQEEKAYAEALWIQVESSLSP
ncbi:Forkhead-associated domain-containing protein / FHA domain-containing protein [Hirschfeldia incana]|nr:Forkhead-associated domain-containing protein / FHA domain-containing protein [Hirschfeldia incana]